MSNNIVNKKRQVVTSSELAESVKKQYDGKFPIKKIPPKGVSTWEAYRNSVQELSVDIPSLINRDTKENNLKKVIKNGGGFDWDSWDLPKAAQLPDGRIFLYDGDHRRQLYKMAFPDHKVMPVRVRKIASVEELHEQFLNQNERGRTSLTKEELFVHQVHAGEKEAVDLDAKLKQVGVRIYCSSELGGTAGNPNGVEVKINAAKAVIGYVKEDLASARNALQLVESVRKVDEKFSHELWAAVSMIKAKCPEVNLNGAFDQWFKAQVQLTGVGSTSTMAKQLGGNVVNHHVWSVAKGLLDMFKGSNSAFTKKNLVSKLKCFAPKKR